MNWIKKGGKMAKANGKISKAKLHKKMCDLAWKDLEQYRYKFFKYKIDTGYYPFFMQLKDAMHNLLQGGICVHSLNSMIKDAKKDAVDFEKGRLADH